MAATVRRLDELPLAAGFVPILPDAWFAVQDDRWGADSVAVLDGEGRVLALHGATTSGPTMELYGGRSSLLRVAPSARVLVGYQAGREVGRTDLVLAPGGVTTVQP